MIDYDQIPTEPPQYGLLYSELRRTSTLEFVAESFKQQARYSFIGQSLTEAAAGFSESVSPNDPDNRRITEEEYRASSYNVPEAEYYNGMTIGRARQLRERYDERRYREELYRRYDGGLAGRALGLAGSIAGAAVDPINYVPFFGPGARAYAIGKLGAIGGRAAVTSAEAAFGSVITQPLVYAGLNREGENYTAADVLSDVMISAMFGGVLGAAAGILARRQMARQAAVLNAGQARLASLTTTLDAVEDSMARMREGKSPDVARFFRSDTKLKDKLLGSSAMARGQPIDIQLRPEEPDVGVDVSMLEEGQQLYRASDGNTYVLDAKGSVIRQLTDVAPADPDVRAITPEDIVSRFGGPDAFEPAKAAKFVAGEVEDALKSGAKAFMYVDGNQVEVGSVAKGKLRDVDGKPLDTQAMLLGQPGAKTGIEIVQPARPSIPPEAPSLDTDIATAVRSVSYALPTPEPRAPEVLAAAPRVGRSPDDVDVLLPDAGIAKDGSFAEMDDVAELRSAGKLTEEDERLLREADDLVARSDNYDAAYRQLAVCTVRNYGG